jgi:hypothetical protein
VIACEYHGMPAPSSKSRRWQVAGQRSRPFPDLGRLAQVAFPSIWQVKEHFTAYLDEHFVDEPYFTAKLRFGL